MDILSFYSYTGAYGNEEDEWYDLRGKEVDFKSKFLQMTGKQPFSTRKSTHSEMAALRNDIGKGDDPVQVLDYTVQKCAIYCICR